MSFYNLSAKSLSGETVNFAEFAGKTVLVVNTASKCGFSPQYNDLEKLNLKYKDKGLVILGFPCNQFGNQEPGNAKEIETTCRINYGVTFRIFEKCDVRGDSAHPVFRFLSGRLPGIFGTESIKWNFTKFLIAPDGTPVRRFAPFTNPMKIEKHILQYLGQ
ncbi:glutathione peroxidase [Seleniivibrio woodruffii]|uniref:glutathione peroxidase n=1 Tax=Seleniivibrio woodruffii TaxID=1078050 RepID=UPI0039E654D4